MNCPPHSTLFPIPGRTNHVKAINYFAVKRVSFLVLSPARHCSRWVVVNSCFFSIEAVNEGKAHALAYLFHYLKFSWILCFKTSLYSYPPQTPTKLLHFYQLIVKAHLQCKISESKFTFFFSTTTRSLTIRWENLPYFSVHPAQVGYSEQAGHNVRNAKDFSYALHTVSSIGWNQCFPQIWFIIQATQLELGLVKWPFLLAAVIDSIL